MDIKSEIKKELARLNEATAFQSMTPRQLAEYELISDDPAQGSLGRVEDWRAATDITNWTTLYRKTLKDNANNSKNAPKELFLVKIPSGSRLVDPKGQRINGVGFDSPTQDEAYVKFVGTEAENKGRRKLDNLDYKELEIVQDKKDASFFSKEDAKRFANQLNRDGNKLSLKIEKANLDASARKEALYGNSELVIKAYLSTWFKGGPDSNDRFDGALVPEIDTIYTNIEKFITYIIGQTNTLVNSTTLPIYKFMSKLYQIKLGDARIITKLNALAINYLYLLIKDRFIKEDRIGVNDDESINSLEVIFLNPAIYKDSTKLVYNDIKRYVQAYREAFKANYPKNICASLILYSDDKNALDNWITDHNVDIPNVTLDNVLTLIPRTPDETEAFKKRLLNENIAEDTSVVKGKVGDADTFVLNSQENAQGQITFKQPSMIRVKSGNTVSIFLAEDRSETKGTELLLPTLANATDEVKSLLGEDGKAKDNILITISTDTVISLYDKTKQVLIYTVKKDDGTNNGPSDNDKDKEDNDKENDKENKEETPNNDETPESESNLGSLQYSDPRSVSGEIEG